MYPEHRKRWCVHATTCHPFEKLVSNHRTDEQNLNSRAKHVESHFELVAFCTHWWDDCWGGTLPDGAGRWVEAAGTRERIQSSREWFVAWMLSFS